MQSISGALYVSLSIYRRPPDVPPHLLPHDSKSNSIDALRNFDFTAAFRDGGGVDPEVAQKVSLMSWFSDGRGGKKLDLIIGGAKLALSTAQNSSVPFVPEVRCM